MNDNETILTIWEFFEPDFSTAAKRKEKAYEFLRMIEDTSLEIDHDLLKGTSDAIDHAIEQISEEDRDDEPEEDYYEEE